MSRPTEPDWDPDDPALPDDQLTVYDNLRRRCPIAFSEHHQWSLLRHEDVLAVALDHRRFSNVVSAHLSVPNGMDPPVHTPYRRIIEPFFAPEPMAAFEPVCRAISRELVSELVAAREVGGVSVALMAGEASALSASSPGSADGHRGALRDRARQHPHRELAVGQAGLDRPGADPGVLHGHHDEHVHGGHQRPPRRQSPDAPRRPSTPGGAAAPALRRTVLGHTTPMSFGAGSTATSSTTASTLGSRRTWENESVLPTSGGFLIMSLGPSVGPSSQALGTVNPCRSGGGALITSKTRSVASRTRET